MPRFSEAFLTLRTCYRHPAGELGALFTAVLEEREWVERVAAPRWPLGGYRLTESGKEALANLGFAIEAITPRIVHKACSDYTERLPDGTRGVPHIAGELGAAVTQWLLSSGVAERVPQPATVTEARTLILTPLGRESLRAAGLLR